MGDKHQTRRRFGLVEVKSTPTFVQFQVLTNSKLFSKVQKPDVSLVTCSQHLLKIAKKFQLQTVFVIGVVRDTHLVLTHADVFTELLIRIFTSTRTKLAQRTGVTGELFAYQGTKCYKLFNVTNLEIEDVCFFVLHTLTMTTLSQLSVDSTNCFYRTLLNVDSVFVF